MAKPSETPIPFSHHLGGGGFPATRWTLVEALRQSDAKATDAALEALCKGYWYPLYSYARRFGLGAEDAQDATQSFLAAMIRREGWKAADPLLGKLRTFLLASFRNHLCDERDKKSAWRRGGRHEIVSMDALHAEERYAAEPSVAATPEIWFDRQWALEILKQALESVKATNRSDEIHLLLPFLDTTNPTGESAYAETAAALGWTVNATRVAVFRLRQRYRNAVRGLIASTLEAPTEAEIDAELTSLLEVVAQ